MGTLDESLFEEASTDINMDEIGVLSKHLANFLEVKYGCGMDSKFKGEKWGEGFGEYFGEYFGKMFDEKRKSEKTE